MGKNNFINGLCINSFYSCSVCPSIMHLNHSAYKTLEIYWTNCTSQPHFVHIQLNMSSTLTKVYQTIIYLFSILHASTYITYKLAEQMWDEVQTSWCPLKVIFTAADLPSIRRCIVKYSRVTPVIQPCFSYFLCAADQH